MTPFYFDVHVPAAVADQLRRRGVDILTAQEDGKAELDDPDLLARSTTLGRVLFTQDIRFKARAEGPRLALPVLCRPSLRPSIARLHRPICPRSRTHRQSHIARRVDRTCGKIALGLNLSSHGQSRQESHRTRRRHEQQILPPAREAPRLAKRQPHRTRPTAGEETRASSDGCDGRSNLTEAIAAGDARLLHGQPSQTNQNRNNHSWKHTQQPPKPKRVRPEPVRSKRSPLSESLWRSASRSCRRMSRG
jgi:hypothetical protein